MAKNSKGSGAANAPVESSMNSGVEREDGELSPGNPSKDDTGEKHLLEQPWTLWHDQSVGRQDLKGYGAGLRKVYTFNSVEDFWCLYNNIKTPSQLAAGSNYWLFKEGIEPKWEDPANEGGGCWTIQPRGVASKDKDVLDALWLHVVLACIGEQFTDGADISGVTVNIRAHRVRLELWTRNGTNEALQVGIGKQTKQFLDIKDTLGYGLFAEKLNNNSKDAYQV